MNISKVNLVYFSATQGTEKVIHAIAKEIGAPVKEYNLTMNRNIEIPSFGADELVIVGLPVYGGRIPVIVEDSIKALKGCGLAVPVAVYGNRHYDDALGEMADYLTAGGFKVCSSAAFVAEHSFGTEIATGRPDADDMAKAAAYGKQLKEKISAAAALEAVGTVETPGGRPYKERSSGMNGIAPITTDACNKCGICADNCPMGIIDKKNPTVITDANKCLRCWRCVKICPQNAKQFDSPMLAKVGLMLKTNFSARREPELFI